MFQTVFASINWIYSIRYLSDQYCYLLLTWPWCSIPSRLAAGSSIGLTNTWCCMCSFELLMMDGKNRLKHIQRLREINKLWNVASCWSYSANILVMHGPMNVKNTWHYIETLVLSNHFILHSRSEFQNGNVGVFCTVLVVFWSMHCTWELNFLS